MSEPELTALDHSCLSDCRIIAAENYAFYDWMYDTLSSQFDKEIVGRVMAQKKDFIDVIESILDNDEQDTSISDPSKTQNLILTLPANDVDDTSEETIRDFVSIHEDRFEEAVNQTLKQLTDETTIDLMKHHLEAAQIAKSALFEGH